MDWLLTLAVLYLFASIFNRRKGPKQQERPQDNESQELPPDFEDMFSKGKFPFEIPDLEGAPVDRNGEKVSQNAQVYHEDDSEQEELNKIINEQQQLLKRAEKLQKRKEEAGAESKTAAVGRRHLRTKNAIPALNSKSALRNAIVYSEILGKPKSLQ